METITQIRGSVFETNSSSTHSLIIKSPTEDLVEDGILYLNRLEDKWIINNEEYGTDFLTCRTTYEKVSLLLLLILNLELNDDGKDQLLRIIKDAFDLSDIVYDLSKLEQHYCDEDYDLFKYNDTTEDILERLPYILDRCIDNTEFILKYERY